MFWKSRHERDLEKIILRHQLMLDRMEASHRHALELEELRHRLSRGKDQGVKDTNEDVGAALDRLTREYEELRRQTDGEPNEEFHEFFRKIFRSYEGPNASPG